MTFLDYGLLAALLVLVPAHALWRSLAFRQVPAPSRLGRYGRTIGLVASLLILLVADWIMTGRPPSALGLDFPLSLAGLAGCGVALVVIAFMAATIRKVPRQTGPAADEAAALMPQSPEERRLFILFSLTVGIGWELLYRGFLLWVLIPPLGLIGAIPVAALAYGLAHGYKSRRLFIDGMVSALLFVGAYVLTGSLWWLILIHSALPLIGLLAPLQVTALPTVAKT